MNKVEIRRRSKIDARRANYDRVESVGVLPADKAVEQISAILHADRSVGMNSYECLEIVVSKYEGEK